MAAFNDTRVCYGGRSIVLREGEFSVDHSKQKIMTFLMFDGKAEEAMNYYVSVFDQAEIGSIHRYGANEAGAEGTEVHARFPDSLCRSPLHARSPLGGWLAGRRACQCD